jgi:hypothetical protein
MITADITNTTNVHKQREGFQQIIEIISFTPKLS